jgi:6-phosphofructokinase
MISSRNTNALVMQSGGCTPVLNRSLLGVVAEAQETRAFGQILGSVHGLEGISGGDFRDLGAISASTWTRIAQTPGAALGSTRRKLRPEEVPDLLQILSDSRIGFLFTIGGNDSAGTAHSLSQAARQAGYPLVVMNIPKTIDNDLVLTDHSPGYGSAARFVALATIGAGQDARAMGMASPITIIEVMGRDAGWLAASAALARREEADAPHLICLPEVPVDENRFVAAVEEAYRRHGFAVAVVAENTRGRAGVLGGQEEPWFVDDFGHPYYDGPARYLAGLVGRSLGVRVRYEKPGTIQRSFASAVSRVDAQEAELTSRAAVSFALSGHQDEMVTLVRGSGPKYSSTVGVAPLVQVAEGVKSMPKEYLDAENYWVTDSFLDYVKPLIGAPLPRFASLI